MENGQKIGGKAPAPGPANGQNARSRPVGSKEAAQQAGANQTSKTLGEAGKRVDDALAKTKKDLHTPQNLDHLKDRASLEVLEELKTESPVKFEDMRIKDFQQRLYNWYEELVGFGEKKLSGQVHFILMDLDPFLTMINKGRFADKTIGEILNFRGESPIRESLKKDVVELFVELLVDAKMTGYHEDILRIFGNDKKD